MNFLFKKKTIPNYYAEKRAVKRMAANLETRLSYGNMFYTGIVLNLSEKGMFISLPSNTTFLIIIRMEDKLLKIPAKVKRLTKTDSFYYGMGVELLTPPDEYLEFVENIK
jgi:hypothetical protein